MTNIKAAEDLNLRPLATAPAVPKTSTLLHAPHQPSNLTFGELVVPSIGYRQPEPITVGYRQPEPIKPVGTAKVI